MKEKNHIIGKIKMHFARNPQKLYSIVYFSNKWKRKYKTVYCYLEKLVMDGYVINVQDTGLLKIYVPAKYTKDPDLAIGEMISEADRIAADYINRYDMKLQRLEIVRKAEKELQNSEVLTKIFGRIKTEGIYVNESDGFAALEEKQDSYVIEDLLKLPEKVDGLEKHLIKQTQIMDQFSKNIELHLAVLTELRDAIKILGGN